MLTMHTLSDHATPPQVQARQVDIGRKAQRERGERGFLGAELQLRLELSGK